MTDDGRHARDQSDPQNGGAPSAHGSEEPTERVEHATAGRAGGPTSRRRRQARGRVSRAPDRSRHRRVAGSVSRTSRPRRASPRWPSAAARERKLESDREAVRIKDARSKKNKRILIGTGATVGVVALIAGIYAASSDDEEVESRCVDENNVVVDDSNCTQPAAQNSGYGGVGFFPIFLGGGGRQYHYNYGGGGGLGQVATGGTTAVPRDGTTVRSGTSGSSGTISRGGLGVTSGGSKGGSSSGSSGSSSGSGGSSSGS